MPHEVAARFIARIALAGGLALATPGTALAQTSDIEMTVLTDPDGDGNFDFTVDLDLRRYFNRVRCECNSDFEVRFELGDNVDPATYDDERVEVYFGADCTNPDRIDECLPLDGRGFDDYGDLRSFKSQIYTVSELITLDSSGQTSCEQLDGQRTIFALVDPEGDDTFESVSTLPIDFDTQPPAVPADPRARGGEESVVVSFDRADGAASDVLAYQVLCARVGSSSPVKSSGERPAPQYDRVEDIEGCQSSFAPTVQDATNETPPELAALDPAFLCGDGSSSAASIRADGLENGEDYHVVLVAVDSQRNASAVYLGVATPRPAIDFWEIYDNSGGTAEGCQSSGATSALSALFLLGLLLRLRRQRAAKALLWIAVVIAPLQASAQPYFDELTEPVEAEGPPIPHWNVSLKFGPYTPGIDDEDGLMTTTVNWDNEIREVGPFERTFGSGDGLMSQVEVERFFAYPFGQLGVALMGGYHRKTAKALETDENGQLKRIAEGEKTAFNLLPLSLSAVYRFTHLDDRFGVPLVPYGRLGLAYYMWWSTKPNGEVSETDGGGKAKGGSLGWQGSVGLALRAERLDSTAAQSLRNEFGVEHAGVYAELNMAQVDGFGSSTALSVGDLTWLAGVNFEF